MGGPKALMTVGGRPWWRWQVERLGAAGMASCWVVNGGVMSAFASCPDAPSVQTLADASAPMFESILTGLRSLGCVPPFVHVLPVDVPCPLPTTFATLERRAAGGVAVPTRLGLRGHPVCLARTWIERHVLAASLGGDARLDRLIRGWTTTVETPDDPDTTINLNTPRDVDAWLASRSSTHA